jgi:hypothetical protein
MAYMGLSDDAMITLPTERPVKVLSTKMTIQKLTVERPSIVAYLKNIPADKLEIALVHALEVGVTELVARRERKGPGAAGAAADKTGRPERPDLSRTHRV